MKRTEQTPQAGELPAEKDGDCPAARLLPGERLDRVNGDLSLIQKTSGQLFSTDALLLAGYLRRLPSVPAAELGSGSGIVSLLALTRGKAAVIDAFEIRRNAPCSPPGTSR